MNAHDNRPVGIFDSGLGGLTSLKAIRALLPHEDLIFFGDTARVPYGNRTREELIRFSEQNIRFLQSKNVKAVVVACNTSDAMARAEVQKEFDHTDTRTVLDRVTGKREFNVPAAMQIWRDHPVFGCGGWGFRHFCVSKMSAGTRKRFIDHPDWHSGSANVHNDYVQALAEHGCVGLTLLVLSIVFLLMPIAKSWRFLYQLMRFAKTSKLPAKPVMLFVLPAPAFAILAGAVAVCVHAFGDCPLRSPAVLVLLFVSLAAIPGFLPRSSRNMGMRAGDGDGEENEHGKKK